MIKLSSTVYNSLIEHVASKKKEGDTSTALSLDGDDVYYRFGGAALCEMLHVRYKQIKTAPLDHKDQISQEITIAKLSFSLKHCTFSYKTHCYTNIYTE